MRPDATSRTPRECVGGPGRSRTCDLSVFSRALFQPELPVRARRESARRRASARDPCLLASRLQERPGDVLDAEGLSPLCRKVVAPTWTMATPPVRGGSCRSVLVATGPHGRPTVTRSSVLPARAAYPATAGRHHALLPRVAAAETHPPARPGSVSVTQSAGEESNLTSARWSRATPPVRATATTGGWLPPRRATASASAGRPAVHSVSFARNSA